VAQRGARHASVQRLCRAVPVRCARAGMWPAGAVHAVPWPAAGAAGRKLRARSQTRGDHGRPGRVWYVLAGTPDREGGCDRSGSQEQQRWFSYFLAIILTATQLAIASINSSAGRGGWCRTEARRDDAVRGPGTSTCTSRNHCSDNNSQFIT
jgi:hypothetical protein